MMVAFTSPDLAEVAWSDIGVGDVVYPLRGPETREHLPSPCWVLSIGPEFDRGQHTLRVELAWFTNDHSAPSGRMVYDEPESFIGKETTFHQSGEHVWLALGNPHHHRRDLLKAG
jgi:hypothetical protein